MHPKRKYMINNSRLKALSVMVVLSVVLMLVGSFMDLEISDAMFVGEHSFASAIGGFFGKLPAFLILVYSFTVLLNYVYFKEENYKKPVRITLITLYIIAILLSSFMAAYSAIEELTDRASYIAIGMAIIATCIAVILVTKEEYAKVEEQKKLAIVNIIAIVVLMFIVVMLKGIFGRIRYKDIIAGEGDFAPWYQPNWFGDGHSFPSGHTALYGALYLLMPLFRIFDRKGACWYFLSVVLTQIGIGLFRIVGGHHFLTDITASMLISFVVAILAISVSYKSDYSNKVLGEKNLFRKI